jgi:hypothetical protein
LSYLPPRAWRLDVRDDRSATLANPAVAMPEFTDTTRTLGRGTNQRRKPSTHLKVQRNTAIKTSRGMTVLLLIGRRVESNLVGPVLGTVLTEPATQRFEDCQPLSHQASGHLAEPVGAVEDGQVCP